jgi:HlyD family secretion protein
MKALASSDPSAASQAFLPALVRLQQAPPSPLAHRVLGLLLLLLGGLLLWAFIGELDVVAVADGKLVPQSFLKIVQPADAGIVREILVKEGATVQAGQVLMRMDAVASDADVQALTQEQQRKMLALRRIDAELADRPLLARAGDPPALVREVQSQYSANRAALASAIASEQATLERARGEMAAAMQVKTKLSEVLPHYREQEAAFDRLVRDGYAGTLMVSDKRRERIEKEQELMTQEHVIDSARAAIQQSVKRLEQIRSDYRRQLHTERNDIEGQLERVAQELTKQDHRRALLELRASQDGVVKDIATHTAGTVVQPGTVLMTLVPNDEVLQAEVWVTNQDIGFVREGQAVKLKFATFPFQEYGLVSGRVERVSVDAADASMQGSPTVDATERTARGAGSNALAYRAIVALNSMQIEQGGQRLALSAGMQTSAEVLLGRRKVIDYLLSPVRQVTQEAARER